MGRILAIDYGQKRTGLAVTDPLGIIAGGLDTVDTVSLWEYLERYIATEPVDKIVVGKPTQLNGEDSENMKRITPFVNRWKKNHPEIPIEMYDERFTSVLAHKVILESGIGRKARQNKALVDKISATIILEEFLQAKQLTK